MRANEFDPLAYIENAFLDKKKRDVMPESDELNVAIPSITDYLNRKELVNGQPEPDIAAASTSTALAEPPAPDASLEKVPTRPLQERRLGRSPNLFGEVIDADGKRTRFKKTLMSAPRPRRAKSEQNNHRIDPELQSCWETLPKSIEFLCSFYDDSVTAHYYGGTFKEPRNDLIKRLLDPELSLEETSRLLGVCPATVRRYTNREWLEHHRTNGGQRRFRLSDIVRFVEVHGRFPEE